MLIQILLYDRFDLLDALAPYEVFLAANMEGGGIEVELVSLEGARRVPSAPSGLLIDASGAPDLDRADILLVPGAAGPVTRDGPDTLPAILAREAKGPIAAMARAALAKPGLTVVTVCGGSLLLAMAGLLKGRHAVTHIMGMPVFETTGAVPVYARVVDDGDVITGGGVTSGLDVALYVLERECGPKIAHAVEKLFEYERRGTVWRDTGAAGAGHAVPLPAMETPSLPLTISGLASPVEGRGDVRIATPIREQAVIYEFREAGGGLTGTATQNGETEALIDLRPESSGLTWQQNVTRPMKLTLRFKVAVDGDRLSGTAKAGMLPSSKVVGQRMAGEA